MNQIPLSTVETTETLLSLLSIHGVSGDEGQVAAYLEGLLRDIPGIVLHRIGDSLIALRGTPRTAIFAHTDTIGYTLGYDGLLIPVGGPQPRDKDKLRSSDGLTGRLRFGDGKETRRPHLRRVRDAAGKKAKAIPGSRWVYAREPELENGTITSPYLDDRAGVWCALRALLRAENSAVAFCTGEEQHGHGARFCADWLYRTHRITQAVIADLTWHTDDTPCGKGVVVSLRDAFCPRQAFLDRVLAAATESAVPFQREVQSAGSSDGGHILRSAVPMDWVFVGAPEKKPHTSQEQAQLTDLDAMADLLTYLVNAL